jgi:uncharacterized membrane protein
VSLITNILISLLLIVGVIIAQIVLSNKENKFLGLVFPSISFIFSILLISFTFSVDSLGFSEIFNFIFALILCNIPTLLLLAIYYFGRKKIKKNSDIDKMNIQDLE